MEEVFTIFATSRFIDSDKVVQELRKCARRLTTEYNDVVAVHLFGSFAAGTATPRSDADIVVETDAKSPDLADHARRIFEEAPVPVELFVVTSEELKSSKGIAAAAVREGINLATRKPES